MIQVSVLYPYKPTAHFDFDYYYKQHMSIVRACLGQACKAIAVNQGLSGVLPGETAPFIVMGHLYFDSIEAFQRSFTPHAERIMADIPNFTDCEPLMQISAVTLVP